MNVTNSKDKQVGTGQVPTVVRNKVIARCACRCASRFELLCAR